jgi:hypothetical protein
MEEALIKCQRSLKKPYSSPEPVPFRKIRTGRRTQQSHLFKSQAQDEVYLFVLSSHIIVFYSCSLNKVRF